MAGRIRSRSGLRVAWITNVVQVIGTEKGKAGRPKKSGTDRSQISESKKTMLPIKNLGNIVFPPLPKKELIKKNLIKAFPRVQKQD